MPNLHPNYAICFEVVSSNIFQHVATDALDNSSARHATFRKFFSSVGFSENPSIFLSLVLF